MAHGRSLWWYIRRTGYRTTGPGAATASVGRRRDQVPVPDAEDDEIRDVVVSTKLVKHGLHASITINGHWRWHPASSSMLVDGVHANAVLIGGLMAGVNS